MELIKAALDSTHELGWLVLVLVMNSVVSLYYYLRVIKELFLVETPDEAPAPQQPMGIFLVAMAAITILFGLYFGPLMRWAESSMDLIAGL